MKKRIGFIQILFIFFILTTCIITINSGLTKEDTKVNTTLNTTQTPLEKHPFDMPLPSILENPKIDTPLPDALSEIQIETLN